MASTSSGEFIIPVVPEPDTELDDTYFWDTVVKDAINQLGSTVSELADDVRQSYGMIYVNDANTPQGSIGTTPVKITGFTDAGPSLRCTSSPSDDEITIGLDGVYHVGFQIAFSGSASVVFAIHVHVDDVATELGTHRAIGTGGDVGSASAAGFISLTAGQVVSVYGNADFAAKSATLVDAQLSVHLLS